VTAFDASFIARFVTGDPDVPCFPVEPGCGVTAKRQSTVNATIAWGEPENERAANVSHLPLLVENVQGTITALTMTLPMDERIVSFEGIEAQLPEDWQTAHTVVDGQVYIAMAGATPLSEGQAATLTLRWLTDDAQMTLTGPYVVNENAAKVLKGVDVGTVPETFELGDNYPNPFNPATTITYQLPEQTRVKLVIYNALGQKVRTLVDADQNAGRYKVRWDSRNDGGARVASGTYLYRIEADGFVQTKTLILVK
jgi:hypothetical protein